MPIVFASNARVLITFMGASTGALTMFVLVAGPPIHVAGKEPENQGEQRITQSAGKQGVAHVRGVDGHPVLRR